MNVPPPPPEGSPWRLARPIVAVVLVVIAAIGVVSGASWLADQVGSGIGSGDDRETNDVEPGLDVTVVIPEGSSAAAIADILASAGVVRSASQFEAAARSVGAAASLRAGTYELVTGMDPDEVIEVLRRGPILSVFDVTVPEGLRLSEVLVRLSEASGLPVGQFEDALTEGRVETDLTEIDEDDPLEAWEGLLFPDTYRFSKEVTATEILQRMSDTLERRIDGIDWGALEDAGFTRYEGLIIASLIEAEVRVPEERRLVSSVIRNRLEDGQRLEIDATVLYALETRDVSLFDRTVDSPYNTYANGGLPPTPIAAPGAASLEAAADPADTDYRYYVLSSEDGSHTFSETLEEHQAAVAAAREAGILP